MAVLSAFALWPLAVLHLGPRAAARLPYTRRSNTPKETTR